MPRLYGGTVVYEGTPHELIHTTASVTGRYLAQAMG